MVQRKETGLVVGCGKLLLPGRSELGTAAAEGWKTSYRVMHVPFSYSVVSPPSLSTSLLIRKTESFFWLYLFLTGHLRYQAFKIYLTNKILSMIRKHKMHNKSKCRQ